MTYEEARQHFMEKVAIPKLIEQEKWFINIMMFPPPGNLEVFNGSLLRNLETND